MQRSGKLPAAPAAPPRARALVPAGAAEAESAPPASVTRERGGLRMRGRTGRATEAVGAGVVSK